MGSAQPPGVFAREEEGGAGDVAIAAASGNGRAIDPGTTSANAGSLARLLLPSWEALGFSCLVAGSVAPGLIRGLQVLSFRDLFYLLTWGGGDLDIKLGEVLLGEGRKKIKLGGWVSGYLGEAKGLGRRTEGRGQVVVANILTACDSFE